MTNTINQHWHRPNARKKAQQVTAPPPVAVGSLPQVGALFPKFGKMREAHRATEFARACRRLMIKGVTLHSYRYAWAERAKTCGYPERFA